MTAKIRVYELAREYNVESKNLLAKMKAHGVDLPGHQSVMTEQQAELARKLARGDAVEAPAAPAAKASASKVVIRRRRADEGPATAESAAPPSAPTQELAPKPVEQAAPVVEKAPVQEAPAPVVVEAAPAPAEVSVAPVAPAAAAPGMSKPTSPGSSTVVTSQTTTKSADGVERRVQTTSTRTPATPRPSVGGATIVRRATLEEQQQIATSRERRTIRREDSRGTRVTGLGLRSEGPRAPGAPAPTPPPGLFAPGSEEEREWNKKKEKARWVEPEEEAAAKPKAAPKNKRSGSINMRTLLSQIDDMSAEGEEPLPDEAAPVKPAPVAKVQTRTVYMPSGGGRRDMKRRKDMKKTQITTPREGKRIVKMDGPVITVGEMAHQMATKAGDLIKKLMEQGVMATINMGIDQDTATLIGTEFGFEVQNIAKSADEMLAETVKAQDATVSGETVTRPPIVTIMGHVDHGKTSILDTIRKTDVAAGEAGGITQHIGAYTVEHNGKKIAFLDTPGHEAFSSMRARGAKVTDIVILVVAADDGVMPQTVEAINHAKSAGVPIIVAVNKIDKPNINLDRVYSELTEHGIQSEEWGGEHQFCKVSALKKTGINELLEAIQLQADLLDLKASPSLRARGTVVEAHLDKGRGPVATIMVQNGTLRAGDFVVAGREYGRVRAMSDHLGKRLELAGPSTPVQITGLSKVPRAGDSVNSVVDEKAAVEAAEMRAHQDRAKEQSRSSASTLDELLGKVRAAELPEVAVILKGDTQGSIEAIAESITKIKSEKVSCRVVHKAVGGVTESDVTLAAASKAVVIGFNVRAARGLDEEAEREGVIVQYFTIIYDLVEAVKALMAGKLPPVVKELVLGHAQVRQPISVPKIGTIAGSAVLDGKITRASQLRLIRDSVIIYNGKIGSLRRFKDDVREVAQGYECGIGIDGYNDIREGDVIEAYVMEEEAPTL